MTPAVEEEVKVKEVFREDTGCFLLLCRKPHAQCLCFLGDCVSEIPGGRREIV